MNNAARSANLAGGVLTVSDPEPGVRTLAEAMIEAERMLVDASPARVVLADDSDLALGAALAASKLTVPLTASEAARRRVSTNGRLIAQLAGPDLESPR